MITGYPAIFSRRHRRRSLAPDLTGGIAPLATSIAGNGGTLALDYDRRFNVTGTTVVDALATARGNAFALTASGTARPARDTGNGDITADGTNDLLARSNADLATQLGLSGLMISYIGTPVTVSGDRYVSIGTTGGAFRVVMESAGANTIQAAVQGGSAFVQADITGLTGRHVFHVRRQLSGTNTTTLVGVRVGARTEVTGGASATVSTADLGKLVVFASEAATPADFGATTAAAVLVVTGVTAANAAAIQTLINDWAAAQHSATIAT